jgi:hypothetical protein
MLPIMPRPSLSGREQPEGPPDPAGARHCDELWLSVLGRGLPHWHCHSEPRHGGLAARA